MQPISGWILMCAFGTNSCGRENRAFTLIELLVVVAIIAVLASLLFPTLARSKQKSQGIQCLNNQRQLCLAWRMYSDDSNERLALAYDPPLGDDAATNWCWKPHMIDRQPNRWDADRTVKRSAMWPYARNLGTWLCPAIHLMVETNLPDSGYHLPVVFGHAMNRWLGGTDSPDDYKPYLRLNQVPDPAG